MLKLTGLYITPEKAYLFASRLKPLMLSTHQTLMEIYEETAVDCEGQLARQVIDLLTTHETSFFRDTWPFQMFRDLLRPLIQTRSTGSPPIRILSAGCSTGEEPYSIAMILQEELNDTPELPYHILAVDIAEPTLERARRGWYQDLEKSIDETRRDTYFERDGKGWRVADRLRKGLVFQQRNLLDIEDLEERFDFVFCRNVAIYFQREIRAELFQHLAGKLNPGGYLIVGASESLSGFPFVTRHLSPCGCYFYRPNLPSGPKIAKKQVD